MSVPGSNTKLSKGRWSYLTSLYRKLVTKVVGLISHPSIGSLSQRPMVFSQLRVVAMEAFPWY